MPAHGGRAVPADEADAEAVVRGCATANADDAVPLNFPARPVLDLCVLVVALLGRVAELERALEEHTARVSGLVHPPF